jgi:GNAT superfamily N-acetyltransferase
MDLEVRPLAAADIDGAHRVLRAAFTALHGVDLLADTDLLRSRSRARHTAVLGVGPPGRPVASIVVTGWGSVGLLGPLSVDPPLWGRGVASTLLAAAVELLDSWGATHQGLFTFADSPRHHGLYQRFGFWPRFLTAVMSSAVTGREPRSGRRLSAAADGRRDLVAGCAEITEAIRPGLDLRGEIDAVLDLGLGDVVLVGGTPPDGFAVCHAGPGSEAGSGIAYVKFAAVRPGPGAAASFTALVDACRGYAAQVGAHRLTLGVSTARHRAYRRLVAAGMRTDVAGVTMHRPNAPGYDTPDTYVLDDWR